MFLLPVDVQLYPFRHLLSRCCYFLRFGDLCFHQITLLRRIRVVIYSVFTVPLCLLSRDLSLPEYVNRICNICTNESIFATYAAETNLCICAVHLVHVKYAVPKARWALTPSYPMAARLWNICILCKYVENFTSKKLKNFRQKPLIFFIFLLKT